MGGRVDAGEFVVSGFGRGGIFGGLIDLESHKTTVLGRGGSFGVSSGFKLWGLLSNMEGGRRLFVRV